MQEFSGHLHQKGWKADNWKQDKVEISGFLHQKGWRSEAWKPRKFLLKGKILHCYLGDSERSAHLIDAESFVSVINRDDKEKMERLEESKKGDKSDKQKIQDEHRFIFTVRTKNITTGYAKNNITLSAPNEHSLNSWLEALSECAFEGHRISIPYLWPKMFRNQSDLFAISYSGRNVDRGTTFKAFQVELAPFSVYSDKKPLVSTVISPSARSVWTYSNTAASLETQPTDVASQAVPILKLFYTLIMIVSSADEESDEAVRTQYVLHIFFVYNS